MIAATLLMAATVWYVPGWMRTTAFTTPILSGCARNEANLPLSNNDNNVKWQFRDGYEEWSGIPGTIVDIPAKGDMAYCGRSLIEGRRIYFIVPHRNYAGKENNEIRGRLYGSEEELVAAVKQIKPRMRVERCPCGCWDNCATNSHYFTNEIVMPRLQGAR